MKKLPQFNLSDEAAMRAFYESCGVSKSTTEAAIRLRLSEPVQQPVEKAQKASRPKGKPKR